MMNFIGKSSGVHGDSGSRQQDEEDEDERQNTGQLFPHPSSSSPSSSHHHQNQNQNQNQNQVQSFHHQPPYHHHQNQNPRDGWLSDRHGGGGGDLTMVDYSVPPSDNNNNNNNNDDGDDNQQSGGGGGGMMMVVEREHMFDKVVTPSDVGKLNRLVIPKQHAERYFPLDSSTNDKGLLLNFEDRNGKPWRFRYSYWNSSQSYVMTKGWSRFVKDKKLDAGDIVSFQRGVGGSGKDRLFIDWRHRPDAPNPPYQLPSNLTFPLPHHQYSFHNRNIHPWNPLFLQSQPVPPARSHSSLMLQPPSYRYGPTGGGGGSGGHYHNLGTGSVVNVNQGGSGSVIYFRSGGGGGGGISHQQHVDMMQMHQRTGGIGIGTGTGMDHPPALPPPPPQPPSSSMVFESVPVVHGKAAAKRLRLFGVNMDCPISDDDDDQDYDPTSYHHDHYNPHHHHHHDQFPPPSSSSSSTIPYLQLRPYVDQETQYHQDTMVSSSSTDAYNKTTKSSSSHMSLDLDI